MSLTVCLRPTKTLDYLNGGGHLWFFLNWALGLVACGCRVIWLETVRPRMPAEELPGRAATLRSYLEPFGLSESLALCGSDGRPPPQGIVEGTLDLEAASESDLLLNLRYDTAEELVRRFRRSAFVDIDPGLLQVWLSTGEITVPRHDVYFSIGETVGQPGARFPDCGLRWHYTPPPVFLPAWPATPAPAEARYTTVSQWWGAAKNEWVVFEGEVYLNAKRVSFLEYMDLPSRTRARLELALCLGETDEGEKRALEERGWTVRSAWDEVATPERYHTYIQTSRGEFSCAKPSCMRLENAWISERSLNYLASAKPAVVQHTGPSRFLPDKAGLVRFRTPEEAARLLDDVETDYERHCRLARALAEEHFDAQKIIGRLLERALA
jgi:hypothetical protein